MTKINALKTPIILLFLIVFLSLGIGMGMAASPVVYYGCQGNAVTELQRLLNASGYPVKVDGTFGFNTKKSLIRFQQANHLVADGFAGEKTWQKIKNTSLRFITVAVEDPGGGNTTLPKAFHLDLHTIVKIRFIYSYLSNIVII